MKDVAKTIKKHLNESYKSRKMKEFINAYRKWRDSGITFRTQFIAISEPGNNPQTDGFTSYYPLSDYFSRVSEITDSECISGPMTGYEAAETDLLKPSNRKRYYMAFAPSSARIPNTGTKFHIDKIEMIIEITVSAYNKIMETQTVHCNRAERNKEYQNAYPDNYDEETRKRIVAHGRSILTAWKFTQQEKAIIQKSIQNIAEKSTYTIQSETNLTEMLFDKINLYMQSYYYKRTKYAWNKIPQDILQSNESFFERITEDTEDIAAIVSSKTGFQEQTITDDLLYRIHLFKKHELNIN